MTPRILLASLALLLASCAARGAPQAVAPLEGLGAEVQVYPAGVIPGARYEWPVGDRTVRAVRLAANITDRQDWGEHDDETGEGFGLGFGQRTWIEPGVQGWHWGARVDLWSLGIDWEDDAPPRSGDSDVLVLQPAVEGGYSWLTGAGRLDLTLSVGAEINVDTDGEDVGEGAIVLLGVSLLPGYRGHTRAR